MSKYTIKQYGASYVRPSLDAFDRQAAREGGACRALPRLSPLRYRPGNEDDDDRNEPLGVRARRRAAYQLLARA